jgi:hypothetical protein
MRIPPARTVAAALALLALPAPVTAQASFTAQQRSVEATSQSHELLWQTGTNPFFPDFDPPTASYTANHSDDAQAPGFAGFHETASSPAPLFQGFIGPAASASTSQTSSLAANRIAASGRFSARADSYTIPQLALTAINFTLMPPVPYNFGIIDGSETGDSQFSVQFDLAEPTPFHLTGSVAVSAMEIIPVALIPMTSSVTSISLTGPSGSVAQLDLAQPFDPFDPQPATDSLDVQGMLAPGSYTLSAHATGSAESLCFEDIGLVCYHPSSSGSFQLKLLLGSFDVPGPSRLAGALLGVALAAIGAAALRRAGRRA